MTYLKKIALKSQIKPLFVPQEKILIYKHWGISPKAPFSFICIGTIGFFLFFYFFEASQIVSSLGVLLMAICWEGFVSVDKLVYLPNSKTLVATKPNSIFNRKTEHKIDDYQFLALRRYSSNSRAYRNRYTGTDVSGNISMYRLYLTSADNKKELFLYEYNDLDHCYKTIKRLKACTNLLFVKEKY